MGRWWRAVGSLLALIGLLVGLPVLLIRIAGWPLPTKMPDWDHVAQMVQQGDLPAPAVLKTLAVVLWVAWLMVLWAFVWEVAKSLPSTSRAERPRPSAPLVPATVSDGVGRLVAAVLALGLLTPSDTAAATTGLPQTVMVAATVDTETAPATFTPTTIRAAPTAHQEWLVSGSDTLWDVAATALGDGTRVTEIIDLNRGLRPERHLRAGQVIDLPADASIPASRRPVTARLDGGGRHADPGRRRQRRGGDDDHHRTWRHAVGRIRATTATRRGRADTGSDGRLPRRGDRRQHRRHRRPEPDLRRRPDHDAGNRPLRRRRRRAGRRSGDGRHTPSRRTRRSTPSPTPSSTGTRCGTSWTPTTARSTPTWCGTSPPSTGWRIQTRSTPARC